MSDIKTNEVCRVTNLKYRYPGTEKGVTIKELKVKEGEIVGLLGESGCGKSTLAKCLSGQITDIEGTIDIKKVGYIFQDNYASLNPAKRVGWLLKEVIRFNGNSNDRDAEATINKILDEVELDTSILTHYPRELSGGQRQRVGIAMALLSNPDILIADEPVSALDVTVQKQIVKLFRKLNEKKGLAILFISHDIKVVKELCDYIYIMKNGETVEDDETKTVFESPKTEYTASLLDSSYLR